MTQEPHRSCNEHAKSPRVHVPVGIDHVILWDNGGQDIFFRRVAPAELCPLVADGMARFERCVPA